MTDEYVEEFAQESEEQITELNNGLLAFENDPSDEAAMEQIFRTAHTLKGNCGAMGFDAASEIAHAIEDLLESIRANRVEVTPELMDAVFAGVDELEAAIDEAAEYGEIRRDPIDAIDRLRAYADVPGLAAPTDHEVADVLETVSAPTDSEYAVYHVRLEVAGDVGRNGSAVVDALDDAFDLLGTDPDRDVIADGDYDGVFDAVFASVVERGAVEAALDPVDAVDDHVVSDVTDRVGGPAADAGAATDVSASPPDDASGESADAAPESSTLKQPEPVEEDAEDLSVDELLGDEEVDQFDDLDGLAEEVGDVSEFDDLEDAGSFADLGVGVDDGEPDEGEPTSDQTDDAPTASQSSDAAASGTDAAAPATDEDADAADDDVAQDATSEFEQLKEEVDPVEFDELQEEIEELEFDEYDSDDEVGFDELLGDEELAEEDAFGGPSESLAESEGLEDAPDRTSDDGSETNEPTDAIADADSAAPSAASTSAEASASSRSSATGNSAVDPDEFDPSEAFESEADEVDTEETADAAGDSDASVEASNAIGSGTDESTTESDAGENATESGAGDDATESNAGENATESGAGEDATDASGRPTPSVDEPDSGAADTDSADEFDDDARGQTPSSIADAALPDESAVDVAATDADAADAEAVDADADDATDEADVDASDDATVEADDGAASPADDDGAPWQDATAADLFGQSGANSAAAEPATDDASSDDTSIDDGSTDDASTDDVADLTAEPTQMPAAEASEATDVEDDATADADATVDDAPALEPVSDEVDEATEPTSADASTSSTDTDDGTSVESAVDAGLDAATGAETDSDDGAAAGTGDADAVADEAVTRDDDGTTASVEDDGDDAWTPEFDESSDVGLEDGSVPATESDDEDDTDESLAVDSAEDVTDDSFDEVEAADAPSTAPDESGTVEGFGDSDSVLDLNGARTPGSSSEDAADSVGDADSDVDTGSDADVDSDAVSETSTDDTDRGGDTDGVPSVDETDEPEPSDEVESSLDDATLDDAPLDETATDEAPTDGEPDVSGGQSDEPDTAESTAADELDAGESTVDAESAADEPYTAESPADDAADATAGDSFGDAPERAPFADADDGEASDDPAEGRTFGAPVGDDGREFGTTDDAVGAEDDAAGAADEQADAEASSGHDLGSVDDILGGSSDASDAGTFEDVDDSTSFDTDATDDDSFDTDADLEAVDDILSSDDGSSDADDSLDLGGPAADVGRASSDVDDSSTDGTAGSGSPLDDPGFSDPDDEYGEAVVPEVDEDRLERIRSLGVPDREDGDGSGGTGGQSIRVDVEQLDDMLNLVEGLVTSRARLRRALGENESPAVLEDELDDLEDVTSELQDTVMDVRLVPLRRTVSKLPRIVRDVAREQEKEVDFEIVGEDVQLDRSILEEIGDPLVHLVRNAVDHGIEAPEERASDDKPEAGSVELRARRERDRVLVTVEDDGRGIDPDALRDAAVEADLYSRAEVDEMDEETALELVFHPGLSTAEEVTDVSGRGVGMDVVAETAESLDGSVSIDSEIGDGTTVELELPVTLAIAEMLFVEVGGEEYGIPVDVVDEIGPVVGVETQDGQEVLVSDGGEDERDLVRLDDALDTEERTDPGLGMLVHLRDDVREATLLCDDVRGQQEIVVKPFEGVLAAVPGLAGATVLGDGDVVNILDVETL